MNQFDNYKKTLEDLLQSVEFIYSGDIINSNILRFVEKKSHTSFPADFFRRIIIDIYDSSIKKMFEKSEDIIIHRNNFSDVYDLIDKMSIRPKIMFYSKNSNLNLNLGGHVLELEDGGHSYLPSYFNRRFKLMSSGIEVSAYYSPKIEDSTDDCCFYLVDRPIQSMVWSLQNMDYVVNKSFSTNEHHVKIPFYECDYKVYRVRVIDTQRLREEKINTLLDGN